MKKRILIIEDEPTIVRGLVDALSFEGFEVEFCMRGADGIAKAKGWRPDCIVLDLMLPDQNGYAVCENIRNIDSLVPIIMLSAKVQEADKVRGFRVGADDYVTKPFSVAELIARVQAIFRRQQRVTLSPELFCIGEWTVDPRKQNLKKNDEEQKLTFFELEILRIFYEHKEQVISREQIHKTIWGEAPAHNSRSVDNFIAKLRKKIEVDPKEPRHILTVYGSGYKFVP